jgi:hypothetical protein
MAAIQYIHTFIINESQVSNDVLESNKLKIGHQIILYLATGTFPSPAHAVINISYGEYIHIYMHHMHTHTHTHTHNCMSLHCEFRFVSLFVKILMGHSLYKNGKVVPVAP